MLLGAIEVARTRRQTCAEAASSAAARADARTTLQRILGRANPPASLTRAEAAGRLPGVAAKSLNVERRSTGVSYGYDTDWFLSRAAQLRGMRPYQDQVLALTHVLAESGRALVEDVLDRGMAKGEVLLAQVVGTGHEARVVAVESHHPRDRA